MTNEEIAQTAHDYLLLRGYSCSEAVVHALNDTIRLNLPSELLASSSAFGGGMASGCACGALTGGNIILGALLGRTSPEADASKIRSAAAELHRRFKEAHGTTCCRALTRKGKNREQCAHLTRCTVSDILEIISRQ